MLVALGGCAGILGIPSDVDHEAVTEEHSETGVPDEPAAVHEAGVDGDAEAGFEAGPSGPCDPDKPFGSLTPLGNVNTFDDEGSPHLSADERTLYFDAKRNGAYGVYFTTRGKIGDPFGDLEPIPSVDNSINVAGFLDVGPNVTDDGRTLFFARQGGVTDSDLWTAVRATPNDAFGTASAIASLDTNGFEAEPYVRGDGSEIWYARQPGSAPDLALARLVGSAYVMDTTGVLDAVNDPTYFDGYPVISKDGLTLYFGSERPSGNPSFGALDIWVATRKTTSAAFGTPHVLDSPANSTDRDYPGFVSDDGCRLYFSSVRAGGRGGQDLYVVTRPQ